MSGPHEGVLMRRHASGTGCGPCGLGFVTRALGRLRDPARAALRPLCEELAALAGRFLPVQEARPAAGKCRSSAPRGVASRVMGCARRKAWTDLVAPCGALLPLFEGAASSCDEARVGRRTRRQCKEYGLRNIGCLKMWPHALRAANSLHPPPEGEGKKGSA